MSLASLARPSAARPDEAAATHPLRLWYRQPAREWVEALPVGNGRLGAMVHGGIATERLQLNEDSFFAGQPYDSNNPDSAAALPEVRRLIFAGDYAAAEKLADERLLARPVKQMSYQPVGDLVLLFDGIEEPRDYVRELDLDGAVACTRFRTRSGEQRREVIASAPDGVIAVRLSAGGEDRIRCTIALASPQDARTARVDGRTLSLAGTGPEMAGVPGAMPFEARVTLRHDGGTVTAAEDALYVRDAREVVLLVAMATGLRAPDDIGGDPAAANAATLAAAVDKPWSRLLADHQADHRDLFRRMTLDLGTSPAASLPTDERVARSTELDDPALAALYHAYGRYLLIAASRPGTQPANLQGIWNASTTPAWESKWTINVNTEMNYWPAPMCGLGECVEPLLRMVKELAVSGARTARTMYGARGWMVHNNTDVYRQATAPDGAKWAMWPMGGAWLLSNLWDQWDYGRDPAFLAELYPLMAGASRFYLDTLQVHPRTAELVTNPSLSPENVHPMGASVCAGPAMDSQLLRDLFGRTAEASRLLGRDPALRREVLSARARLPADRIGKAGQLQEWMDDWDMETPERHHRHVSHLYALYPSEQIDNEATPALAAAARRTLDLRGDDATGWSIGWKLNLWAKLGDGERAYRILRMLLEPRRTYPNLFDAHPPFQIDGNFGGAAGITQMLVQSHGGRVHLLPALPAAWQAGEVRGVRVRGAGSVDLRWTGGRLLEATFASRIGGRYRVRHHGRDLEVAVPRGRSVRLVLDAAGRLSRA